MDVAVCSTVSLSSNLLTGTLPAFRSSVTVDVTMTCVNNAANEPRSASCPVATTSSTAAADIAALNSLFSALGGSQWTRKSGWGGTTDPCQGTWSGVGCANTNPARVTYVERVWLLVVHVYHDIVSWAISSGEVVGR
jgi:hypothetical protein